MRLFGVRDKDRNGTFASRGGKQLVYGGSRMRHGCPQARNIKRLVDGAAVLWKAALASSIIGSAVARRQTSKSSTLLWVVFAVVLVQQALPCVGLQIAASKSTSGCGNISLRKVSSIPAQASSWLEDYPREGELANSPIGLTSLQGFQARMGSSSPENIQFVTPDPSPGSPTPRACPNAPSKKSKHMRRRPDAEDESQNLQMPVARRLEF